MTVICPVSLDCTIDMLGTEVSRLIGTGISPLFKTRHNTINNDKDALTLQVTLYYVPYLSTDSFHVEYNTPGEVRVTSLHRWQGSLFI